MDLKGKRQLPSLGLILVIDRLAVCLAEAGAREGSGDAND